MSQDDTRLVVAHTRSGAEALAKKARKARVVSAFGTVPSEVLFGVFGARRRKRRPSLVYCGDDVRAKRVAARLIRDVGFDPVDGGPLSNARYAEPFHAADRAPRLGGNGRAGARVPFERFRSRG